MSKILSVWKKNGFSSTIEKKIYTICKAMEPDNIVCHTPLVKSNLNWAYGVMNPSPTINYHDQAVLLGQQFGMHQNWWKAGKPLPDGSFALFRDNQDFAEIASDPAGSRSVWYYQDEKQLIASTSQRAIIMMLGNLEFNDETIPWMLSTGTIGPFLSWDKRIKLLPPNTSLLLDKETWKFRLDSNPIRFKTTSQTDEQGYQEVSEAIDQVFDTLRFDPKQWAITLSGGLDSRGILLGLLGRNKEAGAIRTFTYGHQGSNLKSGSDGSIAKRLASKYNIKNSFFSAYSLSIKTPVKTICNRILEVGEGRIDHFGAYLDGFEFWKYLHESNVAGVIRGDIGFGFPLPIKFLTEKEARHFGSAYLCREYSNFDHLKDNMLFEQDFPPAMKAQKGESMNVYHDRLYSEFRIPIVLAALSDLKLSYVEIMNPLLSKEILKKVRQLPEHLRLGSPIWRKYVEVMENEIPYANDNSHDQYLNEISKSKFTKHLLETIIASPFLKDQYKALVIKDNISKKGIKKKLIFFFRSSNIKNLLNPVQRFHIWRSLGGNRKKQNLPKEKLLNRLFIISEMQRLLIQDSKLLKSKNKTEANVLTK
jgi:hypothetical protein